ncbi:hypothetical protein JB92DRAFT_250655 [Gautieria morchelliformis]|nr:hypothetical protein JB92DRAFT_250655 [Gautieria morchelliformis]
MLPTDSTPKYSRPTSSGPSSRGSVASVAPYLTHVVTHHGQVTLVPPQNQGRLRKAEKPRKHKTLKVPPPQESVHILPARSALPSSLTSSPPTKPPMLHGRPLSENLNGSSSAQGSLGDMSPGGCLNTHIVANLFSGYNNYSAPRCRTTCNIVSSSTTFIRLCTS